MSDRGTLTIPNAIRYLVLDNPMLSSREIAKKLGELDLDYVPSEGYIRHIKGTFKEVRRFLRREGLLTAEPYEFPSSMGGPRECLQETRNASHKRERKVAGRLKPESKTKLADDFLRSHLRKHGESWERDVIEAAQAETFSQDQVRRARGRLSITLANGCVRKVGTEGWIWRLPEDGK